MKKTTDLDDAISRRTFLKGGALLVGVGAGQTANAAVWTKISPGLSGIGTSRFGVGVMDIAASHAGNFNLILRSDGAVFGTGRSTTGVLGVVSSGISSATQINSLVDVVSVAAGAAHGLAVHINRTVLTIGNGANGALGSGATTNRSVAAAVSGLNNVVAVAAGDQFSLALRSDGTVWGWGRNDLGQLGTGVAVASQMTPVQAVGAASNIVAIACGAQHSLMLRADGQVVVCGSQANGRLGNAQNAGSLLTPTALTPATNFSDIVQVAAGADFSFFVTAAGRVLGTGVNSTAQLGLNDTNNRSSPVLLTASGVSNVVSVSAGAAIATIVLADGTAFGTGSNTSGQAGVGNTNSPVANTPTLLRQFSELVGSASGNGYRFGIDALGSVWGVGLNTSGELGDTRATTRSWAVQMLDI